MERIFQHIGSGWHYEFSLNGKTYDDWDEFPVSNGGYCSEKAAHHAMQIRKISLEVHQEVLQEIANDPYWPEVVHPHIATPYEVKALAHQRLKTIVLPLVPQIQKAESKLGTKLWYWKLDQIGFDWIEDLVRFLKETHTLPFQEGDRIYLQEEWCINDMHDMYFVKSATPEAKHIGWEPASTMPPKAAQHWFAIVEVRVCQIKDLPYGTIYIPGTGCLNLFHEHQILCDSWNAAYPGQLWHRDHWVVVLDISPTQAPQFLQP